MLSVPRLIAGVIDIVLVAVVVGGCWIKAPHVSDRWANRALAARIGHVVRERFTFDNELVGHAALAGYRTGHHTLVPAVCSRVEDAVAVALTRPEADGPGRFRKYRDENGDRVLFAIRALRKLSPEPTSRCPRIELHVAMPTVDLTARRGDFLLIQVIATLGADGWEDVRVGAPYELDAAAIREIVRRILPHHRVRGAVEVEVNETPSGVWDLRVTVVGGDEDDLATLGTWYGDERCLAALGVRLAHARSLGTSSEH
jgi:hypothetical protein